MKKLEDLEKLKELVLEEVKLFVEENRDEFEFIVDLDDIDCWFIDEKDNSICIDECCNVFIRDEDDLELEEGYSDDYYFLKKVYLNDVILYIVM